jgi:hypothetical protein
MENAMNSTELFNIIVSGGLIAAAIAALVSLTVSSRATRTEREGRRVEFVRMQLQELYGPLQFFCQSNAILFGLSKDTNKIYHAEFVEKEWSAQALTQERKSKQAAETLEVANHYIERVKANNEYIFTLFEQKFGYIDPPDIEFFAQFFTDYTRLQVEQSTSGNTPFMLYEKLGPISFMRPEFIETVDVRFHNKRAQLESLLS